MSALSARIVWLAPVALALIGLWLRAVAGSGAFVGDDVLLTGGEAWYHLRRQVFAALSAPSLLDFDIYLDFGRGAVAPLAPGFDALVGWLAALLPGAADAARVERIAAWSPAVFGALAVAAVAAALAPRFGRGGALVGAALLATGPAHVLATRLGYVNHRAAGSFAVALVLACALRALREGAPSRSRAIARGAGLGAVGAFGFWISMLAFWPLVLALTALFVQAATRDDRDGARRALACAQAAAWVALLGALPFAWPLPGAASDAFSLAHPSRFHVTVLAGFGAWGPLAALGWLHRSCEARGRRIAVLLASGVLLDLATLALVPGMRGAFAELATTWADAASLHAESLEPALGALDGVAARLGALGAVGLALPLIGVALAVLEWRRAGRVELLLVLGATALLHAGAWFGPGGHAAAGLATALGGGACAGALLRRAPGPVTGSLLAAAVLASAAPTAGALRATQAADAVLPLGGGHIDRSVAIHVADWLREHGRRSGDWLETELPPEYGVVAPWELGELILYRGQRATLVDGYSGTRDAAELARVAELYVAPAFGGRSLLKERKVLYVVVPDVEGFARDDVPTTSMLSSLLVYDGSETPDPKPGDPFAATHLRLVYEHGERGAGGALRVYEYVPGARVAGSSVPKRSFRFSLPLRTRTGREFTYRVTVETDPYWGRYVARLPYATLPPDPERFVEALGKWRIECRDEVRSLDIEDWKVRDGRSIGGPGFCY